MHLAKSFCNGTRLSDWRAGAGKCLFHAGLLLAALLTGRVAVAQPAPKITSISPDWIERGSSRELVLTGENLGGVTEFMFDGDAGLTATNVATPAPPPPPAVSVESTGGGITRVMPSPAARDDKRLVIRVTAAKGATLTPRELRVVAAGGVSGPVTLNVGQWPEVSRREANGSFSDGQFVELPAVISGAIGAAAQTNYYRFKAQRGQELIFEVEAARRGSPLDSTLEILDGQGRELARNEDALGLDSQVIFTAPAEGEFIAALHDFRFRGGGEYTYRLTAGPIPYVESFFPFGGQRGKTTEVNLKGYNLDGTTKMTLRIENGARRSQQIRLQTPRGYSNLLPFDVSDLPDVAEAEPNNAPTNAQVLKVPAVVNGKIDAAHDVDRFKFKATADQKLVCEVGAGRFGSKLDALLILTDASGKVLQQNDDAVGTDARIEFDAKKDEEYFLMLRDLTERGGERFGYRLSVRPPSAAAAAGFVARVLPDAVRLHREGSARIRCEVVRTGGFDGAVRFYCENLPAGVYAQSLALPNSPQSGILLLTAAKEAPLGSSPLRVMASGMVGDKMVTVPAEPLNGDNVVKKGYLTVLEPVPFALELTTLSAAMEQNQAGTVTVLVERHHGFAGDVKLVAEGYSAGREAMSKSFNGGEVVVKANETTGKLSITPRLDSEVGTRTIVVRGEATVDGRQLVTYSQPMPVSVSQYPLVLSSTLPRLSLTVLPPGSDSAAGEAETKIRVDRRAGFTGDVDLSIEGLPTGLKSELSKIPSGVGEVTLKLNATDKAALGTNYSFTVVGSAVFNDRIFKTRTSPIALSIAAPESVELATNSVPAAPAPAAAPAGTK